VCVAFAACEPTPEKIARWKDTEKGPGKLRGVVKDGGKPALRAQALAALVEIGMSQDAISDLHASAEADRQAVLKEAAPRLITLAGTRPGTDTTRVEREAKDALFLLRADVTPSDTALLGQIDQALIAWTTIDLPGRAFQGGQASEKILLTIGKPAVPRLQALLHTEPPGGPQQLVAAAILGKVDPAEAVRAADVLVEAAQKSVARTRALPDGLLQALGSLGGPKSAAFLVEQAEHGPDTLRDRALLALANGGHLGGDEITLAAALRLAADKKAPPKVRDAAFQVAEKIGQKAVPGLVRLTGDSEELMRWRAVEAAVAAGKAEAVVPVLEGLDAKRSYKAEDLKSYVVHDLGQLGAAATPALKQELASKSWVARLCAVWSLGQAGTSSDASALAPLFTDGTKLKGLKDLPNTTLGIEAKLVAAALGKKP